MSYEHITVKAIEEYTEGEEFGVTKECDALAQKIRSIYRNVKFGVLTGCSRRRSEAGGLDQWQSMYAYLPGHQYAMCEFGYKDVAVGKTDYRYFIRSRNIRNEKFHSSRDQFHMATSESLDRIFTSVKKYVRPYTPIECAETTYRAFTSSLGNVKSALIDAEAVAISKVTGDHGFPSLREELFGMLDRGYEFSNPTLRENIVTWRTKYQERKQADGIKKHAYYVQVRVVGGEQTFDIFELFDVQRGSYRFKVDPQDVITRKAEDMPEDIMAKLATLSMLEDGQHVDGLGMRASENVYWVERT